MALATDPETLAGEPRDSKGRVSRATVRTRDRPSSQAGNLQSGVYPAPVADPDMLVHWGGQNAQRRGADCPAA